MASKLNTTSSCSAFGVCLDNPAAETPVGDGSPGPTLTNESPFKVTLKSYWISDPDKANPQTHNLFQIDSGAGETVLGTAPCEISSGVSPAHSFVGSDSNDPALRTCGVEIPELQLYYSSLRFEVEVPDPNKCDVVFFEPYYYLASRAKAFWGDWLTSAIDCETLQPNGLPAKDCYGGPAKDLVEGFPVARFLFSDLGSKQTPFKTSYDIKSGHEALNGWMNNRWTAFQTNRVYTPVNTFGASTTEADNYYYQHSIAQKKLNTPYNWHFRCSKKGSDLLYRYEVRIIPIKDNPFQPGGPTAPGWSDVTFVPTFSPTRGPIDGGTEITISNYDNPSLTTPLSTADSIIVESSNILDKYFCAISTDENNPDTCIMPQVADGGTAQLLFSRSGQKVLPFDGNFTYESLALTSLSPNLGPQTGGTPITITGTGIAKNTEVLIDGKMCTVTDAKKDIANDGTSLKCVAPEGTESAEVEVLVKNPTSEQEVTFGTAFTYFKPVITSVSTGICEEEAACSVTVNGTFNTAGDSYLVTVDGQDCEGVSNTGTELTCSFTPAAGSAGQKAVVVTDQFDQSATKTGAVTVTAPAPPPDP